MDDPGDGPPARTPGRRSSGCCSTGRAATPGCRWPQLAGMPPERTQRLWRALGFPDAADDDPAFTDADVARARRALGADRLRLRRRRTPRPRSPGRWASRCPGWPTGRPTCSPTSLTAARAGRRAGAPASADEAVDGRPGACCPSCGDVQDYVWRRHLAANADRLLAADRARATAGSSPSASPTWSATPPAAAAWAAASSGAMVEDFESIAAEVIARHHGRVVKTVGDGVLFTAVDRGRRGRDRAAAARGVGRRGPPAAAGGRRLRRGAHPARRRLLAGGQPGQPADLARPPGRRCWSTASSPSGCAGLPAYRVRPLRRVSVRGYDHLQPWLVRRAAPADEDEPAYDEDLLDEIGRRRPGPDDGARRTTPRRATARRVLIDARWHPGP